jgi:Tol biopolymer transport system component
MRSRDIRPIGVLRGIVGGFALAACVFASAEEALAAGCNIVPRELKQLRSTKGLVNRPIAGPGDARTPADLVTVFANLGCNTSSPGFDPVASNNTVTLDFQLAGSGCSQVTVDSSLVSVDAANCSGNRCSQLRFEVPDTSGACNLPPETPLAGPARILVTRGSTPVVDILDLAQPATSCEFDDLAPDSVFGRFTILPPVNPMPEALPNETVTLPEIRGAVLTDRDGQVLGAVFPWDYGDVLAAPAGDPVATVLEVRLAAAEQIPTTRFLRSFNAFGRPIPPLLRLVDLPGPDDDFLLGTTDVLRAVTRVAAFDPEDGSGPITLDGQTFDQLMIDGIGPVVIPGPVEVTVSSATPLLALRTSVNGTVAIGADEELIGKINPDPDATDLVAEITDVTTGAQVETGMALAEVSASPPRPVMVVDGDLVAFLQSEARSDYQDLNGDGDAVDSVPRAFDDGVVPPGLTPALPPWVSADSVAGVDGLQLALSEGFLFFRTFEPDEAGRDTVRLSERTNGTGGNAGSSHPSANADGSRVAFESAATNLVPGTSPTHRNIFLADRASGTLELVSVGTGDGGNADSAHAAQSADGSAVAFDSAATNLAPLPGLASGAAVWEDGTLAGTIRASGNVRADFLFGLGSAEVSGVDYSGANPGRLTGAQLDCDAATLKGNWIAPGDDPRFLATMVVGSCVVEPTCPVGTVTCSGAFEVTNANPPLPETLESLAFSTAWSVDPSGDFTGSFEFSAIAPAEQVYVRDLAGGTTTVASIGPGGNVGNADSRHPSLSADGRFVAFVSDADNLVAEDDNGLRDVFVRDLQMGITTRASVSSGGAQATGGDSFDASISADGRWVAFSSLATNLVSDDSNGVADVFVHDLDSTDTSRVSVLSGGAQALGGDSGEPSISADGRFVAFSSAATNLVEDDNSAPDIFLHDRENDETRRVSVDSGGDEVHGGSFAPSISSEGRFVAFESDADGLVPTTVDTGPRDVFRFDRLTGSVELMSAGASGSGDADSGQAAISGDGLHVAFASEAANLVGADAGAPADVFMRGLGAGQSLNADADLADSVLRVFDTDTRSLLPGANTAATRAVTAAGRALVFTPESGEGAGSLNDVPLLVSDGSIVPGDGDQADEVAQLYDAPGDRRVNLGVAAAGGALSTETVCVLVSEAGQAAAVLNGDGVADDAVLATATVASLLDTPPLPLENVGVAGDQVGATGSLCVFSVPESAEGPGGRLASEGKCNPVAGGCSANGDADALDRVLVIYDLATDTLTNVGQAVEDFQVGPNGQLLAFRTCEVDQGGIDLNDDGDVEDCVMQIYDLVTAGLSAPLASANATPAATSSQDPLINTWRCAIPCDFPGCGAFQLGAIRADGSVSFIGREECQDFGAGCQPASVGAGGCDLDGDRDGTGRVVHVTTVADGRITAVLTLPMADGENPEVSPFPEPCNVGQTCLGAQMTECQASQNFCRDDRLATTATVPATLSIANDCQFELDQVSGNRNGVLDCTGLLFFFTGDEDGDGVPDLNDNAQESFNPDQADTDGDQQGDAVDPNNSSVLPRFLPPNFDGDEFDFEDGKGSVPLIDSRDLEILSDLRGTAAEGADIRDRDGDGQLTVLDLRLVVLKCSLPGCALPQATLTVTLAGDGSGSVTLDPPGGTYGAGTVVTLTATPEEGSFFQGFSGELDTADTVVMDSATKAVTATFDPEELSPPSSVRNGRRACGLLGLEALLALGPALLGRRRLRVR